MSINCPLILDKQKVALFLIAEFLPEYLSPFFLVPRSKLSSLNQSIMSISRLIMIKLNSTLSFNNLDVFRSLQAMSWHVKNLHWLSTYCRPNSTQNSGHWLFIQMPEDCDEFDFLMPPSSTAIPWKVKFRSIPSATMTFFTASCQGSGTCLLDNSGIQLQLIPNCLFIVELDQLLLRISIKNSNLRVQRRSRVKNQV